MKKFKLVLAIFLGLLTLGGLISSKVLSNKPDKDSGIDDIRKEKPITCYMTVRPKPIELIKPPGLDDLIETKEQVQKLYDENKINKETYDLRMKKIEEQQNNIDSEPEKEE